MKSLIDDKLEIFRAMCNIIEIICCELMDNKSTINLSTNCGLERAEVCCRHLLYNWTIAS
jgi:hypothetical protein